MIIVFPNGIRARMWVDAKDGSTRVEQMLVADLLPHVDANYRTVATAAGRVIEGFSMGGYGAGRIGMSHPGLFGSISIICGGPLDLAFQGPRARANPRGREEILAAVYGSDMSYFQYVSPWRTAERQAEALSAAGTRLRILTGETDFTRADSEALHEHLDAIGVRHDFTIAPGVGHSAAGIMQTLGDDFWSFYR
jgi:enterochelin esterase-like enzyme